jgi:betaine lipid synthase
MGVAGRDTMRLSPHQCLQTFLEASPLGVALALPKTECRVSRLLDGKVSPFLSSIAYQFWHINDKAFSKSFYTNGYSGLALRLAQVIFTLAGVSKDAEAICNASTTEEQGKIWKEKLMPVLLNPLVVAFLKTLAFCWNALGVPLNQRKMLLDEGSICEIVRDTLDPLPLTYSFKDGAYFYPLVRS